MCKNRNRTDIDSIHKQIIKTLISQILLKNFQVIEFTP